MRNLKRALSLTLASVMLLGMMVVGSSAAAGYDDVDVNDNVEAIEVLQAVKVMVGDDRGFGPDRPVTRNEMAVVMGKLLNLDYNYYSASCPFTDVADWAKGWVGAAAANGIVSGRGNGIYDGEATVTAVEAASMMMRALGYFKYQNDYADGFQVATVRQGTKIGIFDQVGTDATTAMTRNQVAQMALNALQTGMVEPDGNTINLTTPDGSVFTGKVNYVNVTSKKDFAHAISWTQASSMGSYNDSYIVELGEQLYNGDLKLEDGKLDDFGRPSRYWEYDGKAIGTYMKKELIKQEYTNEVKGKDLYDLLGSDTIKNYDLEITIDGVNVVDEKDVMNDAAKAASYFDKKDMVKTNKAKVGQTGKGVLTQVFVDPDWNNGKGKIWVSVINTYLAKATNDYNDKKDEIKLEVYGLEKDPSGSSVYYKYHDANGFAAKHADKDSEDLPAAGEDFSKVIDMKKDDIVLVTVANGEIKSVADPQILAAVELSEFSKDNYVVSDSKYEYNTTIDYDPEVLDDYTGVSATQQLKDTEYNLFLDPYGYLIGVEVVEAVKNYIFLTGIDQGNSNLNAKVSDAAGILTDGTFVNFKMNMKDSKTWTNGGTDTVNMAGVTSVDASGNTTGITKGKFQGHALWNTWCTYTVDKDGTYTLTEVGDFDDVFPTDDSVKPAKAGQYADLTADASGKGKEIGTKRVSLLGDTNKYVYGNDNSVYILAEVKEVAAKNNIYKNFPIADGNLGATLESNAAVIVISGVDSVGTGVDNVKINTLANVAAIKHAADDSTATAYPGYIYTLFDKDGYVIAAVLLGEDSGTSKNLVYSHKDSVESEKYNKDSDDWTWTRKVISNGEETLLTQTGDKADPNNSIYLMKENTWYEVTYKADGSVKEVEYAYFNEGGMKIGKNHTQDTPILNSSGTMDAEALDQSFITSNAKGEFVNHIEYLERTLNGDKSTVLYEEVWGQVTDAAGTVNKVGKTDNGSNFGDRAEGDGHDAKGLMGKDNAPSLKGSVLYVDTKASKGFYVHKDVKSVLIQKNNGEKTTSYGSGTSDLEGFLRDLNFEGGTYLFKISAVLVDGRATVVVIHDWNEGSNAPDTYSVTFDGDDGNVTIDPTPLTGIEKGDSVSFTVTPKRGFVVDRVKIGARTLTPVDGVYTIANVTGDITVTIETSADPNVMSDAIAVLKADGSEFKVFYEDAANDQAKAPTGTALANLLIEAAENAGYTGVKAKLDENGKWVITGTDKSGRIELSAAPYDPTATIPSFVGKIDNNEEVYVKKNTALNALTTWGNSTLTTALQGTFALANVTTGLSATTAVDGKDYAAVTATVNNGGFDITSGYVQVTGVDGGSAKAMTQYGKAYKAPAAADMNDTAAAKGTGMTYTVSGGNAKYLIYGGTISAGEVTNNITLAKDYVEVEIALDNALKTAWEIDDDATDTTKFVQVGGTDAVKINLTEKTPTAGKTTVTTASTYDATATGMTAATGANFAAGTHNATTGATVLNITSFAAAGATGKVTITVKTIVLDT